MPVQLDTYSPPKPKRVALIGNPNSGKSTLFHALTGYRQRVAEMHQDLCAITSADANERWVALNKLRVELERLLLEFTHLTSPPAEVESLARLLVALQSLPTPSDEVALSMLWARADVALRQFAGVPAETRRESFWA